MLGLSILSAAIRKALASWNPSALFAASEQGVWYDPSDFSTLFQDAAGSVPVTATGQVVGRILDKSGRGNHATQATTASRPILQQDGNGKYYLAFDGVDDGMVISALNPSALALGGVWSSWWGVRRSSTGTTQTVYGSSLVSGGAFMVVAQSGNQQANSDSGSPEVAVNGVVTGTSRDAVHVALGLNVNRVLRLKNNNLNSYAVIHFGGYSAFQINGRIYQLIIRGALSDAAQIAAAEAYVNSKTGAY